MSAAAIVVCLGALALIGLLPRVFFRRGRLNARWWLTASPFAVSGATLLLALSGRVRPIAGGVLLEGIAMALALAGVALIRWTLATHARPVSLWHQEDDRPDELVTRGAYACVRHPFYASFLLVLLGCALALPHGLTMAALAMALVLLNRTAAREERRLTRAFGKQYIGYMRRTGRFVPIRLLLALALVAVHASAAAAQLGEPSHDATKVVNPAFGAEQSLGNDVAVGAGIGTATGLLVGMVMCGWEELTTVGLFRDEEEEDFQCDVGPPLLAVAAGATAGALVGLIVGAFGGDMPRGNFFEWSTGDPYFMPDDPKQAKIDALWGKPD